MIKGQIVFSISKGKHSEAISVLTTEDISHCAIVINDKELLEATPSCGVVITPIDMFKETNKVVSIKTPIGLDANMVIEEALKHLGKPYNHVFKNTNGAIYCSQLVTETLNAIENDFIKLETLLFDDSGYWEKYFSTYDTIVPKNEIGSHPATIMKNKRLA